MAQKILYAIAADGALYGLDLGSGKIRVGPIQFVAPFAKSFSLNLVDGVIYTTLTQGCGGGLSGFYSANIRNPHEPLLRQLLLSNTDTAGILGRGGPVIAKNGRVYGSTADGGFDPALGDYSNSVVSASLHDLHLVDYYTPANWRDLNHRDLDLGSASPVWFGWKNYNLLASGAKEGVVSLLDADALGNKDHQHKDHQTQGSSNKDHQTPLYVMPRLGNDQRVFEPHGIWGGLSTFRDDEGEPGCWFRCGDLFPSRLRNFQFTTALIRTAALWLLKSNLMETRTNLHFSPQWISADFNLPDPVAIANGVVFALSTGENAQQTGSTDEKRMQSTRPAVLYALDTRSGKVLYQSGSAITRVDWLFLMARFMPWTTIRKFTVLV